MELSNATYKKKEYKAVPKGAEIIKKEVNINVEEIENGYLICKNICIEYLHGEREHYLYVDKKWFAKSNPLSIDMEEIEKKSLADEFEL